MNDWLRLRFPCKMAEGETMEKAFRRAVVTGTLILFSACHFMQAQRTTNITCDLSHSAQGCRSSGKPSNAPKLQQAAVQSAGQQADNPSGGAKSSSPSLTDTLTFINRLLEKDSAGTMESSSGCEVSLIRQHLEKVTLPSGKNKIPGNYQTGVPDRYEYEWMFISPASNLRSDFNLKDIDPDSVKVVKVFSIKIIASKEDKTDPHLPEPDRSIVLFSASNLVKAIHQRDFVDEGTTKNLPDNGIGKIGFLLEPGTSTRLAKDESAGLLLIQGNEWATRFVSAFKHAVELCGGKPSPF
jgi:hypothetical protein